VIIGTLQITVVVLIFPAGLAKKRSKASRARRGVKKCPVTRKTAIAARYITKIAWVTYCTTVMLNEDKFSRPRSRTNRRGQGRGQGQTFEEEAEAKTMRPRPIFQDQKSPLILLCLRHKQSSIIVSSLLSFVRIIINHSSSHNV